MIAMSNIPTHEIAQWVLHLIQSAIRAIGLPQNGVVEELAYVVSAVVLSLGIAWFVRWVVLMIVERLRYGKRHSQTLRHYRRLLKRCTSVISPLVILGMLPFAFTEKSVLSRVSNICVVIYLIFTISAAVSAVINYAWERYNARENSKNLPLAGIRNLCIGVVWIVAVIIIGSVILGKSPIALLTGLGAFATVLMLIFRDSILGFVAGLQLSQNDMVRIGDWIVVPSTIANGIVVDMSLSTVKVQNWDNTIVMLPPYSLVSTSFQNWRGMSDSGSRLISRAVIFSADSIVSVSENLLQSVGSLQGVDEFIKRIKASGQYYDNGLASVNGTMSSNLGLFRAYMCGYLLRHSQINNSQQILVRIMPIDGNGVPLQIYCYTATDWTIYEAVQSEIMEHMIITSRQFGLQPYSSPTSEDVERIMTLKGD